MSGAPQGKSRHPVIAAPACPRHVGLRQQPVRRPGPQQPLQGEAGGGEGAAASLPRRGGGGRAGCAEPRASRGGTGGGKGPGRSLAGCGAGPAALGLEGRGPWPAALEGLPRSGLGACQLCGACRICNVFGSPRNGRSRFTGSGFCVFLMLLK